MQRWQGNNYSSFCSVPVLPSALARISNWLKIRNIWVGNSVEECLPPWFLRTELKQFWPIPFLALWGVWLDRNARLFEDKQLQTFQTFAQLSSVFNLCKEDSKIKTPSQIGDLLIDKRYYTAGACQGGEQICGIGGVLHFSDSHILFQSKSGQRHQQLCWVRGTKNSTKLASDDKVHDIQAYGDSTLVVNWILGEQQIL